MSEKPPTLKLLRSERKPLRSRSSKSAKIPTNSPAGLAQLAEQRFCKLPTARKAAESHENPIQQAKNTQGRATGKKPPQQTAASFPLPLYALAARKILRAVALRRHSGINIDSAPQAGWLRW